MIRHGKTIDLPSKAQVTVRIVGIVSGAEFLVMAFLHTFPPVISAFQEATLNAFSLVVLSTPIIYFWVVKPFVKAHNDTLHQIEYMACLDPLTQLANRRLIYQHLEKTLAGCLRHNVFGALLVLDLDGFKPVNDRFGHEAGDAILVEIATRLKSMTRTEDIVGRLGGDEFIVILSDLGQESSAALKKVELIAKRLISTISAPLSFDRKELKVSTSIGIRFLDTAAATSQTEHLINEADSAMYLAKKAGKGCAMFHGEEVTEAAA